MDPRHLSGGETNLSDVNWKGSRGVRALRYGAQCSSGKGYCIMSDIPVTPLPVSVRISESFKQLATAASALNEATNEFTAVTAPADDLLKKLNLGVDCWVRYRTLRFEEGIERHYEIGYAKINGRWGLALRSFVDDPELPEYTDNERWTFNEGPRHMRIEAIHKLPELMDELVKKAEKATRKVKEGTEAARDVMTALENAATEAGVLKPRKGATR
jgi:hypothetical protein